MKLKYNDAKNTKLRIERGIDFEDIKESIEYGNLICIEEHHNQAQYSAQKIMHVRFDDEVYSIPFVIELDGTFFMKTAYPSRKARKKFLESKGKDDKNNNTKRSPA